MFSMRFSKLVSATILFIGVSQIAYAQDMTGWSDKTVCRLVDEHGTQNFIDEAKSRKLSCSATKKTTIIKASNNPLDSISIPESWDPIKNDFAFVREARNLVLPHNLGKNPEVAYCLNRLRDWEDSVVFDAAQGNELRKKQNASTHGNGERPITHASCVGLINYYHYYDIKVSKVNQNIQDLYIHWAENNEMISPTNKYSKHFQKRSHTTNTSVGIYSSFYGLLYDYFDFTEEQHSLLSDHLVAQLMNITPKMVVESGRKICNHNSFHATEKGIADGVINEDSCATPMMAAMQGQIILGLRLKNEELFRLGIDNLKKLLVYIDKDGIFIPLASSKGPTAFSYQEDVPPVFTIISEILLTLGYDFPNHRIPSGVTMKEAWDGFTKIIEDPNVLKKYSGHMTFPYGGPGSGGLTFEVFDKLTPEQMVAYSSYSWTAFARTSARYVDNHRPDLQKYREEDFSNNGENGTGIDVLAGAYIIDPYMLYEANTKNVNDTKESVWKAGREGVSSEHIKTEEELEKFLKENEEEFVWSSTPKSNEQVASKSKLKVRQTEDKDLQTRIANLRALMPQNNDANIEMPADEYVHNYREDTRVDLFTGTYVITWFFENVNCHANCKKDMQATGSLVLENGLGNLVSDDPEQPSLELRKAMHIVYDKDGNLYAYGELDLYEKDRAYMTALKGNLNDGVVKAKWEDGDGIGFVVEKKQ